MIPESFGFNATTLILSTLFGAIGLGYFVYGKRSGALVPLVCGVLLMSVPYFIFNSMALVAVCTTIAVVPYFFRR